jgi:hypothetical protein
VLDPRLASADEPRHFPVAQRAGKEWVKAESLNRGWGQPGDEFAADPVPRIDSRLMYDHRNAGTPKGETHRQAGQAAADYLNGAIRGHSRRTATM